MSCEIEPLEGGLEAMRLEPKEGDMRLCEGDLIRERPEVDIYRFPLCSLA